MGALKICSINRVMKAIELISELSGYAVNILVFVAVATPLFLGIRLFPIWSSRDWGCDTYYFLLCRDVFRKQRRIPIKNGGVFILDHDEEWYPPVFTVFISMLSDSIVEKHYWLISNVVDVLLINSVCVLIGLHNGWGVSATVLVLYALSPSMVSEYASLTSRAVAALMFNWLLVSIFLGVHFKSVEAILVSCFLMALLIFTHKLAIQLVWFVLPVCAVLFSDCWFILPLVGGYVLAFVVAPHMTVKIIRAHYDILKFWQAFWPDLGKHQIKSSPIYGKSLKQSDGWFDSQDAFSDLKRQIKLLIGTSPFCIALLPSIFNFDQLNWAVQSALVGAVSIYVWAVATSLVKPLRAFGEGIKYLKFVDLFTLFVVISAIADGNILTMIFAGLACGVSVRGYVSIFRSFKERQSKLTNQEGRDLAPIYEFVRKQDGMRLLVLPLHLADRTGYETRKPVLWGAHGYGFENLHDFFPVLNRPIEYFVERYSLTHALVDASEIPVDLIGLENKTITMISGSYLLCEL